MAWIIPVVAVVASVAGTAVAATGAAKAAKAQEQGARDAQRLAELNAMSAERETDRQAANLAKQNQKEEGRNKARASASGIEGDTGSFGLVLEDQMKENIMKLEWFKRSGEDRAQQIRRGGTSAYNTQMSNAQTTRLSIGNTGTQGISDVFGIVQEAGWLS